MAIPPGWKVKRELDRITNKLSVVMDRLVHDPVRKVVYDLTSDRKKIATSGRLPLTDRVAVFVLFQPKGIPASVHLTLDHLRENGFSVFVVSNGALQARDREAIAGKAALILERPNVGYDFGAYRDGIRHLWKLGHHLTRLVLINDSTWFPLRRNDDSLARMEALDADLAGHIYKIEDEKARKRDHVESHLLMISRDFLQSKEFKQFWLAYRMSDRRETTIELGEKGFSQMAIRAGRKVATLMDRDWLLGTLRAMDDQGLRAVLDYTIDSFRGRQRDASEIRRAAASGRPWRDDFLAWVEESLSNSRTFMISATFIMPAMIHGKMGFAKKANDIRFHLARREILDMERLGLIAPIDDAVRAEIADSVRKWVPPKGLEAIARQRTSVPVPVRT